MQGTEPASFEAGILSRTPAHKKYQGDTCPLRDEEKLIRLASQTSQLLRLVKQQSARLGDGLWAWPYGVRSTYRRNLKRGTGQDCHRHQSGNADHVARRCQLLAATGVVHGMAQRKKGLT